MAKNFKSVAESFITSASSSSREDKFKDDGKVTDIDINQAKSQEATVAKPVTKTMTKKKIKERKSRRVNLLMYPSLVDCLKEKAAAEDTSLNDLMCRAAEEFLKNNYFD